MSSPGQKRGTCGHVMAVFDNHRKCARYRDKGVDDNPCVKKQDCKICQAFTPARWSNSPPPPTNPGKSMNWRSRLQIPLLVLPPLSWTQQTLVCWDGHTRNLMEVHLLARRRGLTLSLPPRLAVRRNPAAASRGLMILKTWTGSGVNILPGWRLCWCPRRLQFLWILYRIPLQWLPVISPFLILEPPPLACPLVWLLGAAVPVLFRPLVRLLWWGKLSTRVLPALYWCEAAECHPACWGSRSRSWSSANWYR